MLCAPYLLHVDARSAFENLIAHQSLLIVRPGWKAIPAQQHDCLFPHTSAHLGHLPLVYPLTSSFQHLSRSLGAIRQCQSNNLIVSWEFNLYPAPISLPMICQCNMTLTFSKMTRGPLTPPMVLYRILGVMLYDDDSRGSPMFAEMVCRRQR